MAMHEHHHPPITWKRLNSTIYRAQQDHSQWLLENISGFMTDFKDDVQTQILALTNQVSTKMGDAQNQLSNQVTTLSNQVTILSNQVVTLSNKVVTLSNNVGGVSNQVGALSRCNGFQVEALCREHLKDLAKIGNQPYFHFTSEKSRTKLEVRSLLQIFEYLGIEQMEQYNILSKIVKGTSIKDLYSFILAMCKHFIPSLKQPTVRAIFSQIMREGSLSFSTLASSLQMCAESVVKNSSIYTVLTSIVGLLSALQNVESEDDFQRVMFKHIEGCQSIEGPLWFIYAIWKWTGSFRLCLEVDAQGTCIKCATANGVVFSMAMAEMKSSGSGASIAKKQLRLFEVVLKEVVSLLPGLNYASFAKVLMQFDKFQRGVDEDPDFFICHVCD